MIGKACALIDCCHCQRCFSFFPSFFVRAHEAVEGFLEGDLAAALGKVCAALGATVLDGIGPLLEEIAVALGSLACLRKRYTGAADAHLASLAIDLIAQHPCACATGRDLQS